MRAKSYLFGAFAVGSTLVACAAGAAPTVAQSPVGAVESQALVEQVQYGGGRSCRNAREECGERHGWGTWAYERCVRGRGCRTGADLTSGSRCSDVRRSCSDRYGWRGWSFDRCVRDRGC
jgi:hypothetical protein